MAVVCPVVRKAHTVADRNNRNPGCRLVRIAVRNRDVSAGTCNPCIPVCCSRALNIFHGPGDRMCRPEAAECVPAFLTVDAYRPIAVVYRLREAKPGRVPREYRWMARSVSGPWEQVG